MRGVTAITVLGENHPTMKVGVRIMIESQRKIA